MLWYQIIFIAIVQGITEFFPVSSSGHLILLPKIFNFPDQGHIFDVAVHVGTLGAVLYYFRKDIMNMLQALPSLCKGKITANGKLILLLIISTIPAVIFGCFIKTLGINNLRNLLIIGISTIGYALLMYIADKIKHNKTFNQINYLNAFVVGIFQAMALIPGTSRSGVCITAMRFLGYNRQDSTKFSFLISIPVTIAAATVTAFDLFQSNQLMISYDQLFLAIIVSFFCGILAIKFMLAWLMKYSLNIFIIYRLILGSFLLLLSFNVF